MLSLKIPDKEMFNELSGEFYYIKGRTIQLEHSLVSISKWESKWHKPFLSKDDKTTEETIDYIKCMTVTQNVDDSVYECLTKKEIDIVEKYINEPMTATTFNNRDNKASREVITAELIYYWMISTQVPFECQKWHLNKLLTLIQVCNIKNAPEKKMSKREVASRNKALNDARRAKFHTRG